MWEFSGTITQSTPVWNLDQLYPAGTPFSLDIAFDLASPKITGIGTQGLYRAITGATLNIGGYSDTASTGYVTVNCAFDIGCDVPQPFPAAATGWMEFWMFGWDGPLNSSGSFATTPSPLVLYYADPAVAAGGLPSSPPFSQRARVEIRTLAGGVIGQANSIRSLEEVPHVPEPGTFVLLASGLAGLYARRKRKMSQRR